MTDSDTTTADPLQQRIRQLEAENARLQERLNAAQAITRAPTVEHVLQSILDNMPSIIGYWDRDLRNRFANQAYSAWFGVDPAAMSGMHIRDVIGEDTYRRNLPHIEAALRGERQQFERAFASADGKPVRHSLTHYIPNIADGQVNGFYALVTDVTALKEAEEALRLGAALYRGIIEDQTEVISRFRPDGSFVFVNNAFCRLFGKSADELIGHRWQPAVAHPDDVPMIEARLREMTPENTVVTIENRVLAANGEIRWMQFVNRGFFDAAGTLLETQSVGRDISQLKQVESNLRDSEETLHRAQSVARIGSFVLDNRTEFFSITTETARLFDLEDKGVASLADWFSRVHPDDRDDVASAWQAALRGARYDKTYRIVVQGQIRWIRAMAELRFNARGQLTKAVGTVQDISDLKQVEANLRESDERLEMALAGSGLVLWDWNIAERKVAAGNRWFELLGYTRADLSDAEDDWMALINPRDLEPFKQKLSAHLQGETAIFESEHQLRHKHGHWVSVEAKGKVTRWDKDHAPLRMVGTLLDISQRKRLNDEGTELLKRIESLIRESSGSPANAAPGNVAESLTQRQRQILGMIAAGMTSVDIGKQLNLATSTVISHRRNLMAKLDLHNSAEVARFAIQHGLLTPK